MKIEFLSTLAVIAPDPPNSRKLYVDALGLPLAGREDDGYHHTDEVGGCKHFGVWPLSQAAEACFGTAQWPTERPVPQVSIEFDVADAAAVAAGAQELQQAGYELLHDAREEPWGQTVARLQSVEGAIIGISYVPAMH
jgi:catechol 2,3-dioxygenase-like lactoylglutathione lyase family enzyme